MNRVNKMHAYISIEDIDSHRRFKFWCDENNKYWFDFVSADLHGKNENGTFGPFNSDHILMEFFHVMALETLNYYFGKCKSDRLQSLIEEFLKYKNICIGE